jgi:hypothetical protein
MWSALSSIVLGIIGWWISKLVFEPVKELVDLRRETQEALLLFGNLDKDAPLPEREEAAATFRRLGAGFASRHLAAYPWVTWWCERILKWDIYSAGSSLMGIGHLVRFEGFSKPNLSPMIPTLRQNLRLPSPSHPRVFLDAMAQMGAAAPPTDHSAF